MGKEMAIKKGTLEKAIQSNLMEDSNEQLLYKHYSN
jgi:hypothetical protein